MKSNFIFIAICVLVIWFLSGAIWWMKSLFAVPVAELSDIELMNKYYAEQTIQNEMRYFAMKNYLDNLSTEEYIETFFKVQHDK